MKTRYFLCIFSYYIISGCVTIPDPPSSSGYDFPSIPRTRPKAEIESEVSMSNHEFYQRKNTLTEYFTIGSTKETVLKIQGPPTRRWRSSWDYDHAKVHFDDNDRVLSWSDSPSWPLKAKINVSSDTNLNRIVVGMDRSEVVSILGQPWGFTPNKWYYDKSTIYLGPDGKIHYWEAVGSYPRQLVGRRPQPSIVFPTIASTSLWYGPVLRGLVRINPPGPFVYNFREDMKLCPTDITHFECTFKHILHSYELNGTLRLDPFPNGMYIQGIGWRNLDYEISPQLIITWYLFDSEGKKLWQESNKWVSGPSVVDGGTIQFEFEANSIDMFNMIWLTRPKYNQSEFPVYTIIEEDVTLIVQAIAKNVITDIEKHEWMDSLYISTENVILGINQYQIDKLILP